jgi:uncharacterized protein
VERLFLEGQGPGEVRLEAVLHRPEPQAAAAVAVCHPHPQYGGDMDNYVVIALCERLSAAGMAALRFNFRGTGKSEGSYEGGAGEVADLAAALRWLRGHDEISRLGACGYSFGAMVANRAKDVAAIACVSPANPLVAADVPLLLVSGEEDQFVRPAALREFADQHEGVEVEVFPGVDHFWQSGLGEVTERVVSFLRRHLV